MKQALEMFSGVAAAEEEYGRRLIKSAKAFSSNEEVGTLKDALDKTRAELESIGRSYSDRAASVKTLIEVPLQDLIARQKVVREAHLAASEKNLKARQLHAQLATKTQEKHMQKYDEVQQLTYAKQNTYGKEAERAARQLIKSTAALVTLDAEQRRTTDHLRDASMVWEREWRESLRLFQALEEERIYFLAQRLDEFIKSGSEQQKKQAECEKSMIDALKGIDTNLDISLFIRSYATGTAIPTAAGLSPMGRDSQSLGNGALASTILPDVSPRSRSNSLSLSQSISQSISQSLSSFGLRDPPSGRSTPSQQHSNQQESNTLPSSASTPSFRPTLDIVNTSSPPSLEHNRRASSGSILSSSGYIASNTSQQQKRISTVPASSIQSISAVDSFPGQLPQTRADEIASEAGYDRRSSHAGSVHVNNVSGGAEVDLLDPRVPVSVIFSARALFDYTGTIPEELSFVRGQLIDVVAMQEDGWWVAQIGSELNRLRKLIPSNYMERV